MLGTNSKNDYLSALNESSKYLIALFSEKVLHPITQGDDETFQQIRNEYGMWICPNGGSMKDSVFRVGHIGYLKKEDYDKLVEEFEMLRERRVI